MRELRELAKDPHDSITVLPGEQDVAYWNCVISGPDSTPYRNGGEHDLRTTFLAGLRFHTDGVFSAWILAVSFPVEYPLLPPEM